MCCSLEPCCTGVNRKGGLERVEERCLEMMMMFVLINYRSLEDD